MKFGSEAFATTQTQTAVPSEAPRATEAGPPAPAAPVEDVESLETLISNPERYRIRGEHGRGAIGCVSRAHDRKLGRDIAIKELISRGALNEARFMREALITARLQHPGIVPVYEAGYWPDGTPFYAMKLVAGRSLRDLLAERETIDERIPLLHHVIAVADAIAYAHGRNIIHRDLKPANVVVGDFGETVVIDWGLAKDLTAGEEPGASGGPLRITRDDDLTAAGSVIGTPAYMPPEQRRGEPVDQRADVFAIGAMLWELCALQRTPPASAPQRRRVLRRAGIDRDLIAIIDKAVDPDPARRYPDAGALASDLKAFKSGTRIGARSYSLYAMLAHWTRRHRAIALSVTIAIVLTASGTVMYVRNIAAERDRALAFEAARRERDRAQLSEASQLLVNDPNRAKDLLAGLNVRSPQYALLTGRMQQLSAAKVVPVPGVVDALFRAPGSPTVEMVTRDGGFRRLEPSSAQIETIDKDLTGAVTYRAGQWLYARQTFGAGSVRIASPAQSNLYDVDLASVQRLVALNDAVYALDGAGDLHRLDGKTAAVVDHGVRNIAGDGDVRLLCKNSGELEIRRKDAVVYRGRCPASSSQFTMAAVHDDYAVLTADRVLIAMRNGRQVEIPTAIRAEYELALSSAGLIAISDYRPPGTSWYVRPDGNALEAGPSHNSEPNCVAVDGTLAAWGYTDGTVIVLDTASGTVWPLRGQSGAVNAIAIDAANARVVTVARHELRVWELKQPLGVLVRPMSSCEVAHLQPSPDGRQVAMDCKDGQVRVWTRGTRTVTPVHSHAGTAFGVQWVKGMICSGGHVDGHVVCSNPDGTDLRTLDSGANRITWLTASPDHDFLVFASNDNRVWKYDDSLQELYMHNSVYRLAVSPDGRLVGTCAFDGSLAVYDLANHRLIAHVPDHRGPANNVAWVDNELWTFGNDGELKRWAVHDGAVTLRHTLEVGGSMHYVKVVRGAWAANAGDSVLVAGRDGDSIAVRVDLGRSIDALDVSPDQRYVAAGVNGEIVVVDLQRNAIATMTVGSPRPKYLSFLDAATLAFSEVDALKTVDVDHLEYVKFQTTNEP